MKKLLTRTLFGLLYLAVMVAGIMFNKFLFLSLMLVIMTLMMHEFYKMNVGSKYPVQQLLATLTGWTIFTMVFIQKAYILDPRVLLFVFIPVFALMASLLYIKDKSQLQETAHMFTAIIYIALPLTLFNFLVFPGYCFNGTLLLIMFILVWMSDIGAYVFGMALGQKYGPKLCPEISPKKSWIGFWGGVAFTVGAAVALHYMGYLSYNVWHCVALGVVVDVTGVFGDLIESVWKRHAGIKDSGNVIPGHGGMMDRLDSALMAIPAAVVYLFAFGLL